MCMSPPKPPPLPTRVDTGGASEQERALRRRRAGQAALFRTEGGRLGDTSTPNVATTALLGGGQ